MAAALNFFVPAHGEGASIGIDDRQAQNHVLSSGRRSGTPRTFPLHNGERCIGFLQLHTEQTQVQLADDTLGVLSERIACALTHSLAYEREQRASLAFQYAALTTELPTVPGFRLDSMYEAGRAETLIGGDWYDAFLLDDGRLIVSVGDVMGSGLTAAVAMVNIRQSLRTVALLHPDPVLMLEAANRTLAAEFPERLATTFVALIDPITRTCAYANAGHPPPLLRLEDGTTVAVHTHGVPLGVPGFSEHLRVDHLLLPQSSLLLVYTDGLTEAKRRPAEGEAFLRAALSALDPADKTPTKTLYEQLLAEGARDDVAILSVFVETHADIPRWRVDPRWSDASRRVRCEIRDMLARDGLDDQRLFHFELIYAEIVANLIRHAGGIAEFLLQRQPDRFVLHVLDKGPGFQISPRLPNDLFSENGRGLYLISRLADGFSVERRPGGGSHARISLLVSKGAHT
ncbi:MAG TPA: SpoIIE family protein phosphatase [Candidatus Baltobacteraceae bacterium]|nr:SpoIIE family protein phosphatase [Candidatus Baltobacteraceae bacterium]